MQVCMQKAYWRVPLGSTVGDQGGRMGLREKLSWNSYNRDIALPTGSSGPGMIIG